MRKKSFSKTIQEVFEPENESICYQSMGLMIVFAQSKSAC